MEQPILGRIEQLTFNPHNFANQESPVDSGRDFSKRQDEINRDLFKRFDETSKVVNHNFRMLNAAIAALGTVLIEKCLTTFEEIDELADIAIQVVDEKSGSGADKAVSLTDVDREEFELLAKPLVEFLQTKCHPHMSVIVEYDRATLVEDQLGIPFKVPD